MPPRAPALGLHCVHIAEEFCQRLRCKPKARTPSPTPPPPASCEAKGEVKAGPDAPSPTPKPGPGCCCDGSIPLSVHFSVRDTALSVNQRNVVNSAELASEAGAVAGPGGCRGPHPALTSSCQPLRFLSEEGGRWLFLSRCWKEPILTISSDCIRMVRCLRVTEHC